MKKNKLMLAMAGAMLMWICTAFGQTSETNFTFSVNQAVPDGSPLGLTLATNLTIAGGNISDLTVNLDISGGFNGDLYAYLAGPNGGFAVLLNRVGVSNSASAFGYSDSGMNVTFSDSAANDIHYYQNVPSYSLNGTTWQPDGENIDPQSPPSDFTGTQSAMLSSFDNANPNGTWVLFLADLSSGGQSTVVSWGLDITTAPEPSTMSLTGLGLAGALMMIRRRAKYRIISRN